MSDIGAVHSRENPIYRASGDKGVELTHVDGTKPFVGSQNPVEFREAIIAGMADAQNERSVMCRPHASSIDSSKRTSGDE